MPILIAVSGALGIIMAALYYPHSPFYLFGKIELLEVWLWAKYSAFLGAILLVFILLAIDPEPKGRSLARSLSIFVMSLNGMLQLPAIALYIIFLRGASALTIDAHGQSITISLNMLFFHIVTLLIMAFSSAWIGLTMQPINAESALEAEPDIPEALAS